MGLSFPIDDKIAGQLKGLAIKAARRAEVIGALEPDERAALSRQARISTIGATTRIENAVLTDAQIDWIDTQLSLDGRPTAFKSHRAAIQSKLTKDRERSLEEVAGCREMLALVYDQGRELFPLTQAALRGLHHELLKYHPPAGFHLGRYKLVPNSVVEQSQDTGQRRIVLRTSDPGPMTEAAISDLLDWYHETLPHHPWPLAVASELVFRFLACHPFQDGNGRLGRALYALTLVQCSDEDLNILAPYLAIDRFIEQRKVEYYAVLARTSTAYSEDPKAYDLPTFLRFMLKVTDQALDAILFYKERIDLLRGLSEAATVMLACFKERPEQRLTPRAIREQTGLAERTVSRALRGLLNAGLLQRYGRGAATRYQLVF